ncbi:MAG: N-acetylmuramoyl-L-alanine amidase [Pseudoruegeria sp.]
MFRIIFTILVMIFAASASAQDFSALARLDARQSYVRDNGEGLDIQLLLSQPVPYRIFTLTDPKRMVLDFREVDFGGIDTEALRHGQNSVSVRVGVFRPGWSRMVVDLSGSQVLSEAGMRTDADTGRAVINVKTKTSSADEFITLSGQPNTSGWEETEAANVPDLVLRQDGNRPLRVVLDPGHGGIDPGAERESFREADLMLLFAKELKENLLRSGDYVVTLTRTEDVFVPLEARVAIGRKAEADVFISLHADALAEGRATGTTLYTLSDAASDKASALLAERHDRADLLAGVDLSEQDDVIATVLMEMVRIDTMPRSEKLARALLAGIKSNEVQLYKKPKLSAGFSVLKAPDIPSVLIELGFMSNPADLNNLKNPNWRKQAADGIVQGLQIWAAEDAAEARFIRQ